VLVELRRLVGIFTISDGDRSFELRRGDGGRSAGVERAAHHDDFDDDNEPCSARRRATAQGGSRAAAMHLSA